jgi:CheY-like chemotaxis protein
MGEVSKRAEGTVDLGGSGRLAEKDSGDCGGGQQKAVLVIDDDLMNTQLFTEICDATGWRAVVAVDGRQGIGKARDIQPDLILLDLMMPRMDGFSFLSMLNADPRLAAIPVVVVTAIADEISAERALALGAIDYVRKPFRVEELKEKMTHALALSVGRRRSVLQSRAQKAKTPFGGTAELVSFLRKRMDSKGEPDLKYGLIICAIGRNETPDADDEAVAWLTESVLMAVRRPQWLFHLDDGSPALVAFGLDGSAVIQNAHRLFETLQKERGADVGERPIHIGCTHGVRTPSTDSNQVVSTALQALAESRSSQQGVVVIT